VFGGILIAQFTNIVFHRMWSVLGLFFVVHVSGWTDTWHWITCLARCGWKRWCCCAVCKRVFRLVGATNLYCNTFYLLASLQMPDTLAVLTHSKTLSNFRLCRFFVVPTRTQCCFSPLVTCVNPVCIAQVWHRPRCCDANLLLLRIGRRFA